MDRNILGELFFGARAQSIFRLGWIGLPTLLLNACVSGVIVGTPKIVTATPAPTQIVVEDIVDEAPEELPTVPPVTATPEATQPATSEPTVEPTAMLPTATPTPDAVLQMVLLSTDDSLTDSSLAALSHSGALELSTTYDIDYQRLIVTDASDDFDTLTIAGNDVIVVVGEDLSIATRRAARKHPDLLFVGVGQESFGNLPANYILLGGDGTRHDQLGFVAGVMAGLATQGRIVGALTPADTLAGRKYAGGFERGLRLTCGDCDYWPVQEHDYSEPEAGRDAFRNLERVRIDTLFAAPGPAGESALRAAARAGLWVIGTERDQSATLMTLTIRLTRCTPQISTCLFNSTTSSLVAQILHSPIFRADNALIGVIVALQGDNPPDEPIPFSYSNGTMGLAPSNSSGLTPAELKIVEDIIERLESGQLGTGIDPLTGDGV